MQKQHAQNPPKNETEEMDGALAKSSNEKAFEFHKLEYQLLRTELNSLGTESFQIYVLTLSALGIYFYFIKDILASFPELEIKIFVYWLPTIMLFFAYFKQRTNEKHISDAIAPYLRRIELKYSEKSIGGWETFVEGRKESKGRKLVDFALARNIFWRITSIMFLIISTYLTIREVIS